MIHRLAQIGCLLLLAAFPALGQQEWTPVRDATGGVPRAMLGEMPRPIGGADPLANLMMAGMTTRVTFDDNAGELQRRETQVWLQPSLAVQQARARMEWSLAYQPEFVYSTLYSGFQRVNQSVNANFLYQLSPRLRLRLREDYRVTTDLFQPLSGNEFSAERGGTGAPAVNVIVPDSRRTSVLAGADLTYRLSARDNVGLKGSFDGVSYSDTVAIASAAGYRITTASPFFSHEFSPKHTVGITGDFVDLIQDTQVTRTRSYRVMYFHEVRVANAASISFLFGPEYSDVATTTNAGPAAARVSQHLLSPAAGAVYSWQRPRTDVQLSYMRRVTAGSTPLGAARSHVGMARTLHRFTRHWSGELRMDVSQDSSLLSSSPGVSATRVIAQFAVERQLSPSFSVRMAYRRAWQDGFWLNTILGNHNRLEAAINYKFLRPFGR